MAKEKSPEHIARIDAGAVAVQELAEVVRKMPAGEKAGAIRVMQLIKTHGIKLGYRNVCRPLNGLLKELT